MKTIKSISTNTYSINLSEYNDTYVISYVTETGAPKFSESLRDFKIASYLFDVKLEELQGLSDMSQYNA